MQFILESMYGFKAGVAETETDVVHGTRHYSKWNSVESFEARRASDNERFLNLAPAIPAHWMAL